jgi:hypothetical protein
MKKGGPHLFGLLCVILAQSSWAAVPPLDEAKLQSFAGLSLACIGREYTNRPNLTVDSASDLKANRELHPIFYGCFDWHSAVHAHWALARILKFSHDEAFRARVAEALDRSIQPEAVGVELKYFTVGPSAEGFERPYGYGWFLRLMKELRELDHPRAKAWVATLEPLEKRIRELYLKYFSRFDFPVRVGLHENTAFAMAHAYDYARSRGDEDLMNVIRTKAQEYYAHDRKCPLDYEPSGEDFLSPCLAEADVMSRVLEPSAFRTWFHAFVDRKQLDRFLKPISPNAGGMKDPRTVHLVGLNFQKAWTLRRIANRLGAGDPWHGRLLAAAEEHSSRSRDLMFRSDYGGTHWLASFALFDWTGAND